MPGKDTSNRKKASAVPASTRLAPVATASSRQQIAPDTTVSVNFTYLSELKGNVLLEDAKPGQPILLNATSILNQPVVYQTNIENLKDEMRRFSPHIPGEKDMMIYHYNQLLKQVLADNPAQQLSFEAGSSAGKYKEMCMLFQKFDRLAVLRQLCFGEPIPLIDTEKMAKDLPGNAAKPSSKTRKIGKPATSETSQTADDNKTQPSETNNEPSPSAKGCPLPYMAMKGGKKAVFACYPSELKASIDRLAIHIKVILGSNLEGILVTSHTFALKAIDNFKQRAADDKAGLQLLYRDAFQACNQFIKKEGTARSNAEWLQFMTDAVHLYALRHVLLGKPLTGCLPGDLPEMDNMLQALQLLINGVAPSSGSNKGASVASGSSTHYGSTTSWQIIGEGRFEDMEKLEDITMFFEECAGIPVAFITDVKRLKRVRQRAQDLCDKDTGAAKQYFNELTKSCRKSAEEVLRQQDLAKIGVPSAVEEMRAWWNDCLYWCVLRKLLHDVPMPCMPGRTGTPVDGGLEVTEGARVHDCL